MPLFRARQRRAALIIPSVGVGAVRQKYLDTVGTSFLSGNMQWGGSALRSRLDGRSFVQKQDHHVRMAVRGGQMQRRQSGVIRKIQVTRIIGQILGHQRCVTVPRIIMNGAVLAVIKTATTEDQQRQAQAEQQSVQWLFHSRLTE